MTPAELETALMANGRLVSQRALRDWRRKGLLPKLHSVGKGRGRGIVRRWLQPHIQERAEVIDEFMRVRALADDVLFHLAAAGYRIESELLRRVWIKHIHHRHRQKSRAAARRFGGASGIIPAYPSATMLATLPAQYDPKPTAQIVLELFRGYFDPPDKAGEEDAYVLIMDVLSSYGKSVEDGTIKLIIRYSLKPLQGFIDLEDELDRVHSASNRSLLQVQLIVARFYRILRSLSVRLQLAWAMPPETIATNSRAFGPILLRAALAVCEYVDLRHLNVALRRIEKWSQTAALDQRQTPQHGKMPSPQTVESLRDLLRQIWAEFEFKIRP